VDGVVAGDALLEQPFMGGGASVGDVVTEVSAKTGERVVVRRVARFQPAQGQLGAYVHMTGKIGVLVELEGAAATTWRGTWRCTWPRRGRWQ
jgi:translation elongation factor EF-Ts